MKAEERDDLFKFFKSQGYEFEDDLWELDPIEIQNFKEVGKLILEYHQSRLKEELIKYEEWCSPWKKGDAVEDVEEYLKQKEQ